MALREITRKPGRNAALCGVTLGALALGACSSGSDPVNTNGGAGMGASAGIGGRGSAGASAAGGTGGTLSIDVGTGGSSAFGGTAGTAGTTPLGGGTGGTSSPPPYLSPESGLDFPGIGEPSTFCDSSAANALVGPFCELMMWNVSPARRVLYSWTTAEQVEELRRDEILLTRTETADLGRGYAFTSIDELAARGSAPENQLLSKLSSELFVKVRYAWSNAWATRMGWPGEDYGDQLLRIVLKPEAWILVVSDRVGIAVIDLDNNLVPMADAIAHSERIGAVYFYKKDITGNGSFLECSGGYREFIVGNEAMVEEWSLGTEELRDQIEADAAMIDEFMASIRAKPPALTPATFNQYAVCSWDQAAADPVAAYVRSLSIPSEYYTPLPAELTVLADTLRSSLFDPDPLVVKPGG